MPHKPPGPLIVTFWTGRHEMKIRSEDFAIYKVVDQAKTVLVFMILRVISD